jgi:hypothetical protein
VRFVAAAPNRCRAVGVPSVVLRLARHALKALVVFTVLEDSCRAPPDDGAFAAGVLALSSDVVDTAPR